MKKLRQENKFYENIQVVDIAEEGRGVGKLADMVVFIDKAVPGDVVDIELTRKKKNFAEARIITLKQPSAYRQNAFCSHFPVCGGCKWQHMDYQAQLKFKQQSVANALQRIAGIDTSRMEPILASASTQYYRNKLEFTFSNKRWLTNQDMEMPAGLHPDALGYHIAGRFDKILDIHECFLQADPSNAIRNEIRRFAMENKYSFYDLKQHSGDLRNLIIRTSTTGELMVIVVFAYADDGQVAGLMRFIKTTFPQITSLLYIRNQKKNDTIFDQQVEVYSGRDHIVEEMVSAKRLLKFQIGPKTFYQTNSGQAQQLYQIAKEFAAFTGNELVYDLYTGAGTIANFIATDVKKVIGIEYVPDAIEDAKINSTINGINNTSFFAGDMKDMLTPDFINQNGRPDVIITDPPRAGMHPGVVARLMEIAAPKIVYVSCNAATQARDIALMKDRYTVTRIRPVDMFPHTQHVENVVLMELV